MRRFAWWLLTLPGCWLSDSEITSKWDDTEVDTDDVDPDGATTRIESVSPEFGTTAGGATVQIVVDSVGPDVRVTFDGSAARLVRIDGTQILVETPEGAEGAADVEVTSGGTSGVADGGYWYWSDATGESGATGAVFFTDYVGDLERLGYVDEGTAWFRLHRPSDVPYSDLYGDGLDRCSLGERTIDQDAYDLGDQVRLRVGSESVLMAWDPVENEYRGDFDESAYFADDTWRLEPPSGTPWPSFGIDPLAVTPNDFVVLAPDFDAPTTSDSLGESVTPGFSLSWQTPVTGDYVVVRLVRWGPTITGAAPVEEARCLLEDDGSFTLPSNLFVGWNSLPSYPIDVTIGRVFVAGNTLPHNNGENGVTGGYRVSGTVWQGF
jgi:hypothetical protein